MSDRLTVVLWKWRPKGNWKVYTAGHVNAIVEMVDAYCDAPFDVVLITDDPEGVHPSVRCVPLRNVEAKLPAGKVPQRNAYRRVALFADHMREVLGEHLMQIDLDTVFVKNFTDLAMRPEPFVIWKSPSKGVKGYALNPSFILLKAGARSDIYDRYAADVGGSAAKARADGWTGTDQAIIALYAGDDVVTVDDRDGIVSFRDHLECGAKVPDDSVKLVSFMDRFDPADPALQERCPWIADHYPYRRARSV
jgi:hypothetical protein